MKPWNDVPIFDNKEKLVQIPKSFNFVDPHPYYSLGAPYDNKESIWKSRESVVKKLLDVDDNFKSQFKDMSLIIYDSWRPLKVQEYMFKLAFDNECKKEGLDLSITHMNIYPEIVKKIEKFWAYPSDEENCPPPHSTGAALDISLVDKNGKAIEMGSNIDQMDDTSKPEYFENINDKSAFIWHQRRNNLKEVMLKSGFAQHPNEWWHFSYGDQLWAWKKKKPNAIYGKVS